MSVHFRKKEILLGNILYSSSLVYRGDEEGLENADSILKIVLYPGEAQGSESAPEVSRLLKL